jgi:hypothetical protein
VCRAQEQNGRRAAASPDHPRRARLRCLAGGVGGPGGPRGDPPAVQGSDFHGLHGRGAAADPREPGARVRRVRNQRPRASGAGRQGDPLQAPLRRHRPSLDWRSALRRAPGGHGRVRHAGLSVAAFYILSLVTGYEDYSCFFVTRRCVSSRSKGHVPKIDFWGLG